jgi:hypothetical protein
LVPAGPTAATPAAVASTTAESAHLSPAAERVEPAHAAMTAPSAWERVLGQTPSPPPPPPEVTVVQLPADELPPYLVGGGSTLLPADIAPPDTPAEPPAPARNGRPYGRHG